MTTISAESWRRAILHNSPLLWCKDKLLNTWRYRLPHPPLPVTPLPDQTPRHSSWQNIWGSSMCAHGPGNAPAPWQQGGGSGTPGSNGWRGTPFPGPAGESPPSPPLQIATRCQGSGKRSRSWQMEGAPGWGWQSCTGCMLPPSRTPCCGGQKSVCRGRRAPRSWSRKPTGCWVLCPGPSCPCGGCRLVQHSGDPQLDRWFWTLLMREKGVYFVKH